ncbi:MAG: UUP1 family membrane protein [Planctomycetes bacterium]|nr:UUP1 family membrane protein [Planctomycetota bacterium]
MRIRDKVAAFLLVVAAFGIVFLKIRLLGPSVAGLLPEAHYEIRADMSLDGHGEDVQIRMAVPAPAPTQSIRNELVHSADFRFHIEKDGENRWGTWERAEARGRCALVYSATVRTEPRRFELPPVLPLPARYPQGVQVDLLPASSIQSGAAEIRDLAARIVPEAERKDAAAILRAAFAFCRDGIRPAEIKGTTDALTCLRLREGSCGGKSRLFAALLRASGIPARLADGLILKDGTWTSTHVWVEAWLGGMWVPFCPLNDHFAEIPSTYLILCHGDAPVFSHTRDINFDYVFHGKTILAPPMGTDAPAAGPLNLWAAFEHVGIPVNLLKIILLMPVGALVVVIARNLVGLQTFGTFMPSLMAVAFRDTGLLWGLVLFIAILIAGGIVRAILERFRLLHTPRLGIVLTAIVGFIVGLAVAAQAAGAILPTRATLFPLVILTLTVERFARLWDEEGIGASIRVTLATMLVVAAAFATIQWESLQAVVLAFPETLLIAVAAFFVIGRWTGLRLAEFVRFRSFLITRPSRNPGSAESGRSASAASVSSPEMGGRGRSSPVGSESLDPSERSPTSPHPPPSPLSGGKRAGAGHSVPGSTSTQHAEMSVWESPRMAARGGRG